MRNDFTASSNPLGMPDLARKALIDSAAHYDTYPPVAAARLEKAIGAYLGVDPKRICSGAGARNLIYRIICGFRPKKGLVFTPTFPLYQEALEQMGCEVDEYLLKEENDFQADSGMSQAIRDTQPDLVFLSNPNTPTGSTVKKNQLADMIYACRKVGAKLVIDECYMDFVMGEEDLSILREVETMNDVIVLKSFSASFAMEGLRVGYCVCGNPAHARMLREEYNDASLSVAACEAATAAMDAFDYRDESRVFVALERERLIGGMLDLGLRTYRTQANYIMIRSKLELEEALSRKDVKILNVSDLNGLSQRDGYYYRIAVRSREENRYLLKVLADVLE